MINDSKSCARVAILSCVNIKHMSLISLYTDILKREGVAYDVIYMDKYGEDEEIECNRKYRYINKIDRKLPRFIKKIKYYMFKPWACRVLKKNKYDFVIVWNDLAIFLFADFLSKHLKGRYCLNVRDNMYYDRPRYGRMYQRCFSNSSFNTISSKGFLDFLPKGVKYYPINSLNLSVLRGMKIRDRMRTEDEKIRIGFVGYVRFFERNEKLLDCFANDPRYEVHFYGTGANVLKKYAESKGIRNGVFHDSFPVSETAKYLENIDIMNNLYGNNTLNIRKAISIKLFHSLYSHIPVLVNTDTYVGEVATSIGVGYYVTEFTDKFKDDLYKWYHNLNFETLAENCENYLSFARKENKEFEDITVQSICCFI